MAFLNMTNQISGWQRQGPVKLVLLTYPFCYEISCSPTFCQDFQQENLVELTFLSPVFLPYIHSPQESNFIFLKYTSSHALPWLKSLVVPHGLQVQTFFQSLPDSQWSGHVHLLWPYLIPFLIWVMSKIHLLSSRSSNLLAPLPGHFPPLFHSTSSHALSDLG